jgi:hypothetical protein
LCPDLLRTGRCKWGNTCHYSMPNLRHKFCLRVGELLNDWGEWVGRTTYQLADLPASARSLQERGVQRPSHMSQERIMQRPPPPPPLEEAPRKRARPGPPSTILLRNIGFCTPRMIHEKLQEAVSAEAQRDPHKEIIMRLAAEMSTRSATEFPSVQVRVTVDDEIEGAAVIVCRSSEDAWTLHEACKHGNASQPSFIRIVDQERAVLPPLRKWEKGKWGGGGGERGEHKRRRCWCAARAKRAQSRRLLALISVVGAHVGCWRSLWLLALASVVVGTRVARCRSCRPLLLASVSGSRVGLWRSCRFARVLASLECSLPSRSLTLLAPSRWVGAARCRGRTEVLLLRARRRYSVDAPGARKGPAARAVRGRGLGKPSKSPLTFIFVSPS